MGYLFCTMSSTEIIGSLIKPSLTIAMFGRSGLPGELKQEEALTDTAA